MVDGRRTDGCRLDEYTLSSPCEPNGSGELIKYDGPGSPVLHTNLVHGNRYTGSREIF